MRGARSSDTYGWSGGRWASIRRLLGDGENPLTWGVPLYSAFGIRVRVHVFFLFYIAAELVRGLLDAQINLGTHASLLAILFLIVLLHEYGHCIACRAVGGQAEEVLLWPLGGLAFCAPPHRWRAELMTTLGGPAVNVILFPVLAAAVFLLSGSLEALLFNPLEPDPGLAAAIAGAGIPSWLMIALWQAYFINLVLLLFNMLVPMYPMDAGRMMQALLWRRMGYRRSMELAVIIGIGAAIALGTIGIVARGDSGTMLLGVAIFGGITCSIERSRLRFVSTAGLVEDDLIIAQPDEPTRAERRREEKERAQFEHVEQILEKIQRHGMQSLTRAERRTLARETRRRRDG